jgi:nitrite reductase (NADH) large subunit
VKTEEEVMEVITALVQLYREQGRYLERIYKWNKRVGSASIKAAVLENLEKRKALYDRFVFSQKFSQTDPWEERTRGFAAHEFKPMADLSYRQAAE